MKFTIQDASTLDPAALAEELVAALGSNFGISTAGTEITTNQVVDEAKFQAVLDTHVANAANRIQNKVILKQISDLEITVTDRRLREAVLGTDNGWLTGINTQISNLRKGIK